MLSRVADSLYWMSRYLERSQHTARLVGVNLSITLDRTPDSSGRHSQRLGASLIGTPPDGALDLWTLATQFSVDPSEPSSLWSCVASARENARQIREQISSEMWERVNALYWRVRHAAVDSSWHAQPDDFFRAVIEDICLLEGITDATMSRGEGWHYIQFGRFLERAQATALLLDVHFRAFPDVGPAAETENPADAVEWVGLLRSCTAFEAYCRRYTATLQPRLIAEFLLLDAELPRSVRFAAEQVESSLRALTRLSGRSSAGRPERLAGRLRASLNYAVMDEIMADSLHDCLGGIRRECNQIHEATYQTFITYQVEPALI